MEFRNLLKVAIGVGSFIIVIVAVYLANFGYAPSHDQAVWGAFGDYFGGILNPIFAVLAFFGVLWTIGLQTKQMGQIGLDKQGEEILQVVKDIDARVSELLRTVVADAKGSEILISHMAAEAERICGKASDGSTNFLDAEAVYMDFLLESKSSGSVSGIAIREISKQVAIMVEFLKRHPPSSSGGYSAIVDYYAIKTARLVPLLNDLGLLSQCAHVFFTKSK